MRKLFLLFALIAAAGASAQKRSFVRVLTYNVCEGLKMDTTALKERFVAWMRELDPDMAALQEMNGFTQARLEKLAADYGHSYAVLLKDTGYPVALTSKYPIVAKRVTDNMHHGFLIASTGGYNIVVAHLSPFNWCKRQQEVATILAWIEAFGECRRWIVLGDLNSYSPLDREGYADGRLQALNRRGDDPRVGGKRQNLVDGELDFTTQQALLDVGFCDAFKLFHSEYVASYPSPARAAGNPDPVTCRLDYVYLSRDLRAHALDGRILREGDAAMLSDHLPLYIDLKR